MVVFVPYLQIAMHLQSLFRISYPYSLDAILRKPPPFDFVAFYYVQKHTHKSVESTIQNVGILVPPKQVVAQ